MDGRTLSVAGAGAVALVAVGLLIGRAIDSGGDVGSGSSGTAQVTNISRDGDSICLDRDGDTCGIPIIDPEDRNRIKIGSSVTFTEASFACGV